MIDKGRDEHSHTLCCGPSILVREVGSVAPAQITAIRLLRAALFIVVVCLSLGSLSLLAWYWEVNVQLLPPATVFQETYGHISIGP